MHALVFIWTPEKLLFLHTYISTLTFMYTNAITSENKGRFTI